jgi:hypothetical protein
VHRGFVVNSVVEQIPGRLRAWSTVSDVWCQLPLVCLPSRAKQPVVLVVRSYVISQVCVFLGRRCCTDVEVRFDAKCSAHLLRRVVRRLESDCPQRPGQLPHRRDHLVLLSHGGALSGLLDVCP